MPEDWSLLDAVVFHTTEGVAHDPKVSGSYVVWGEQHGEKSDIYGYDVTTESVFPVAADECSNFEPSIAANLVVWNSVCPTTAPEDPTDTDQRTIIRSLDLESGIRLDIYRSEYKSSQPIERGGGMNARAKTDGRFVVWLTNYGCPATLCRGALGTPMAYDRETDDSWQIDPAGTVSGVGIWNGLAWTTSGLYDLHERRIIAPPLDVAGLADDGIIVRQGDSLVELDPVSGYQYPLAVVESNQSRIAETSGAASVKVTSPVVYSTEQQWLIWSGRSTEVGPNAGDSTSTAVIYLLDLRTGDIKSLTSLVDFSAFSPSLDGNILAWEGATSVLELDGRGARSNVFVARLPSADQEPPRE